MMGGDELQEPLGGPSPSATVVADVDNQAILRKKASKPDKL
jgi:hypothetical protein